MTSISGMRMNPEAQLEPQSQPKNDYTNALTKMTSISGTGMMPGASQLVPKPPPKSDYTTVIRFFIGVHLILSAAIAPFSFFLIWYVMFGRFALWSILFCIVTILHLLSLKLGRRVWIATNTNTRKSVQDKVQDVLWFKRYSGFMLLFEIVASASIPYMVGPPFSSTGVLPTHIAVFIFLFSLRIVTIIFVWDFQRELEYLNPSMGMRNL